MALAGTDFQSSFLPKKLGTFLLKVQLLASRTKIRKSDVYMYLVYYVCIECLKKTFYRTTIVNMGQFFLKGNKDSYLHARKCISLAASHFGTIELEI